MKGFYEKYRQIINPVLLILGLVIVIYGSIHFFVLNNDTSLEEHQKTEIQMARDSITSAYKVIDSLKINTTKLEAVIDSKNEQLDDLKVKETVIKETYHETIKYIDRYTPNDINVYFDKRYGSGDSTTVTGNQ